MKKIKEIDILWIDILQIVILVAFCCFGFNHIIVKIRQNECYGSAVDKWNTVNTSPYTDEMTLNKFHNKLDTEIESSMGYIVCVKGGVLE